MCKSTDRSIMAEVQSSRGKALISVCECPLTHKSHSDIVSSIDCTTHVARSDLGLGHFETRSRVFVLWQLHYPLWTEITRFLLVIWIEQLNPSSACTHSTNIWHEPSYAFLITWNFSTFVSALDGLPSFSFLLELLGYFVFGCQLLLKIRPFSVGSVVSKWTWVVPLWLLKDDWSY